MGSMAWLLVVTNKEEGYMECMLLPLILKWRARRKNMMLNDGGL